MASCTILSACALRDDRILVVLSAKHHKSVNTFSLQSQTSLFLASALAFSSSTARRCSGLAGRVGCRGAGAAWTPRACRTRGPSAVKCVVVRGSSNRLLCISETMDGGLDTARFLRAPRHSTATVGSGSFSRSMRRPMRFLAKSRRCVGCGKVGIKLARADCRSTPRAVKASALVNVLAATSSGEDSRWPKFCPRLYQT